MGLFSLGGSASSSQSLNNSINFNPNFNLGDNNKADSTSRVRGGSTSSALNKDSFGLSASVGVGVGGGSGRGGPSILSRGSTKDGTDIQPMAIGQPKKSFMNALDKNTLVYGGVILAIAGMALTLLKKKGK